MALEQWAYAGGVKQEKVKDEEEDADFMLLHIPRWNTSFIVSESEEEEEDIKGELVDEAPAAAEAPARAHHDAGAVAAGCDGVELNTEGEHTESESVRRPEVLLQNLLDRCALDRAGLKDMHAKSEAQRRALVEQARTLSLQNEEISKLKLENEGLQGKFSKQEEENELLQERLKRKEDENMTLRMKNLGFEFQIQEMERERETKRLRRRERQSHEEDQRARAQWPQPYEHWYFHQLPHAFASGCA